MDTEPELSVVIINWNTRTLLVRCLDNLLLDAQLSQTAIQVIVVDNASHDDSVDLLRSRYPGVACIANRTNVGFARANNQATSLAMAPLLFLLNSDTAVQPGALHAINSYMAEHPSVGIVGLQLVNDDLSLQPSGKHFPTLLSTTIGLIPVPVRWRAAYDHRRNWRDYAKVACVDEVSGAAMVVRCDVWQALRGFDEQFYFFGEDIDLCWRAREAGYDVAYLPTARTLHTWGGARVNTPSIRQGLMSQRAHYMLIRKHCPAWQASVLRIFLIALTAARLVRSAIKLARHRDPHAATTAYLYARELSSLLIG